MLGTPDHGRVVEYSSGLRWRVLFSGVEHDGVSGYLRELAASDCSAATLRSYAFDLLRWLRFIEGRALDWRQAERVDLREFVEMLRETPNPQRLRRRPGAPAPGSVNARTGKPELGPSYAPRTINHQLSVLAGFYDWAIVAGLGPLVNPVPAQRIHGRRPHPHHNPAEDFSPRRRARYRQKVPVEGWRGMPDEAADCLFGVLRSNRDRALVSFWLTSGVRASELLALRHGDVDIGRSTITVVSKGTRLRQAVPASVDAFVWLALYLAGDPRPPQQLGGPLWWTRQGSGSGQLRPLTYHGARAVLERANAKLGTNWTLHDLRHTAAARLIADPSFSLVDVQTVLRHAQITTTQLYTQPRLDEVVAKVVEHYAQPPASPTMHPQYDAEQVNELLGLQA